MRRTKKEEVNGRPIIELPEKVLNVVEKRLTRAESIFYRQLEKNSQEEFNEYVREGWRQNYHHILVRHSCKSPLLPYLPLQWPTRFIASSGGQRITYPFSLAKL